MDLDYLQEYMNNKDLVIANFKEVAKELFKFDGYLDRTKYWTFVCPFLVCSIILGLVLSGLSALIGLFRFLSYILALVIIVATFCPTVRRLRDGGWPWQLVFLEFLCLGIVPFILCFLESKNNGSTQVEQSESPKIAQEGQPAPQNKDEHKFYSQDNK